MAEQQLPEPEIIEASKRGVEGMVRAGMPMVEWTYSPEEWARFVGQLLPSMVRRNAMLAAAVTALLGIAVALWADTGDSWVGPAVGLGVLALMVGALAATVSRVGLSNRMRRHSGAPPSAVSTSTGVLFDGDALAWRGRRVALKSVRVEADAVLVLAFGTPHLTTRTLRIPVPQEFEEQLDAFVERLAGFSPDPDRPSRNGPA